MIEKLNEIGSEFKCPVAIMLNDKRVLCGYRNYTRDKYKKISVWTNPGGRCEIGETLGETLKREVKEEVGIIEFEILDFIGEAPGAKDGDTIYLFLCDTKEDFKLMEPEKFSEWRWVPVKEYLESEVYRGFNLNAREVFTNYFKEHIYD